MLTLERPGRYWDKTIHNKLNVDRGVYLGVITFTDNKSQNIIKTIKIGGKQ
jgi:hypothetical protein